MKPAYVQTMIDNKDVTGLLECGLKECIKEIKFGEHTDALISFTMMEEIACVGREEALEAEVSVICSIIAEFPTEETAEKELMRELGL